jgi:hypothetical protein
MPNPALNSATDEAWYCPICKQYQDENCQRDPCLMRMEVKMVEDCPDCDKGVCNCQDCNGVCKVCGGTGKW